MRLFARTLFSGCLALGLIGCGSDEEDPEGVNSGSSGGSTGSGASGGGIIIGGTDGTGTGSGGGSGAAPSGPWMLPAGFTKATKGGFKLGEEITGDNPGTGSGGS